MANNVYTYISFEDISDEAIAFLDEVGNESDETKIMCMVYDIPYHTETSEDKVNTYDWYIENVGAKWMYIEDISCYGFSTTSAWSPPLGFCDAIFSKLQSLNSPDLLMWCRYDDEMPNFVGVYGRYKTMDYDEYVEGDESYEQCIGDLPYSVIPSDNDEEEDEYEYNEDWNDSLDTWCDEEYKFFMNEIKDYEDDEPNFNHG